DPLGLVKRVHQRSSRQDTFLAEFSPIVSSLGFEPRQRETLLALLGRADISAARESTPEKLLALPLRLPTGNRSCVARSGRALTGAFGTARGTPVRRRVPHAL